MTLSIPEIINVKSEDQQPEEHVVIFSDYLGGHRAPFYVHWFTRPRYRHCYLLKRASQGTLVVNPLWDELHIYQTPWPIEECTIAAHLEGNIVRRVTNRYSPRYTPRGLITCVSVIKAILGINHAKIITPYQLDGYLLKHRMMIEEVPQ